MLSGAWLIDFALGWANDFNDFPPNPTFFQAAEDVFCAQFQHVLESVSRT